MNSEKYFLSKKGLLVDGVFSNLLSYLLFWTLSFALVFVYEWKELDESDKYDIIILPYSIFLVNK